MGVHHVPTYDPNTITHNAAGKEWPQYVVVLPECNATLLWPSVVLTRVAKKAAVWVVLATCAIFFLRRQVRWRIHLRHAGFLRP